MSISNDRPAPLGDESSSEKETAAVARSMSGAPVAHGTGADGIGVRGMSGPLMKTKQAAQYLAIGERQLQYLSKRGEIAVISIGKSGVRYHPADLDEFVARHRRRGGRV